MIRSLVSNRVEGWFENPRNVHGATPLGVCAWASVNFHQPGDYAGCARRLLEAGSEIEDWMFKATPEVCEVLREYG